MLGTIIDVMVILPCPLQLQEVHKDPYNLDQDKNIIQGSLGTILGVMSSKHDKLYV